MIRIPILLLLALYLHGSTLAAEADPNILSVLVHDQSPFDLKVYDPKSPLETPDLDRLAAEGMVFDGAYHTGSFSGAECSPSRHMIMSERTVWRLPNAPGAIDRGKCPPELEQQTLPAVFNRAGYATSIRQR
ncbi:MAG: sulfatase-like hydrolase/transferase [Rhodopirellula sp.]|nr:sulfatase-like hydrolase/transferase [Rhodopirellula sp.]